MKTFRNFRDELIEASYPGNLGIMELVKFKRTASVKDKKALADHIKNKRHKEARELINKVTGSNLHPIVQESLSHLTPSGKKIDAWNKTARPTNKIAIQGHQVHMDKDGMKIYHGGELVHHKEGDFSNPTNRHKSMATSIITARINKQKQAERKALSDS